MQRQVIIEPDLLTDERLDTGFYSKEYLEALEVFENSGYTVKRIGEISTPWSFGAYALTSQIEWTEASKGVPFLKAESLGSPLLNEEKLMYVTETTHNILTKSKVHAGDIVVSTSGTIGNVAVLPAGVEKANSNQDTIKFNPKSPEFDNYFLAIQLCSKYGQAFLRREGGGAVQQHIYLFNFKRIPVFKPDVKAQKYIGDKVRQAERLRSQAQKLHKERLSLLEQKIDWADRVSMSRMSFRSPSERLSNRLDAKYYDPSVESIRLESRKDASINSLKRSIRNGFECREFVADGIPYITVSEVVSGRLEVDKAPQVGNSVEVPDKAFIDSKTVLAVRTGNIGTVVQPMEEDSHAVISSHLIRLKLESEEIAAVITAYLNSAFGQKLQKAAIYGSVQPEISQDELLKIRIPKNLFGQGEKLWSLYQASEHFYRYSKRLIQAAQYFVEALIEPETNLTEKDLIKAYENPEADRALMERLKVDGFDGEGDPLFPDLDTLADLIKKATDPDPAEG
ncbi:restriction endonuclease subunit S [Nodosilinea sp. LEGE 07298]|uniref:restriction endonuclease subunit S n=1 Tax=Nodosilinea sp. LEGE 07298 TaxID=2777970 RepID=UPI001880FC71|nr:restriction endonuclease subunit S [Nodosilinea sp. LEGE 07298]MBE9112113.1 restriction endonuclease subunit S [Nodosilinea sp. LEGE 07298]